MVLLAFAVWFVWLGFGCGCYCFLFVGGASGGVLVSCCWCCTFVVCAFCLGWLGVMWVGFVDWFDFG